MITTWEEVLKRDDLVGGDIESIEDGIYYRGPLQEIKDKGSGVEFISPWVARLDGGEWQNLETIYPLFIDKEIGIPTDIGEGRIHVTIPLLGGFTIFPKGGSKLESTKVKGLILETMK